MAWPAQSGGQRAGDAAARRRRLSRRSAARCPARRTRIGGFWALTEDGHASAVKSGENSGAMLRTTSWCASTRRSPSWNAARYGQRCSCSFSPSRPVDAAHPRRINLVLVDADSGRAAAGAGVELLSAASALHRGARRRCHAESGSKLYRPKPADGALRSLVRHQIHSPLRHRGRRVDAEETLGSTKHFLSSLRTSRAPRLCDEGCLRQAALRRDPPLGLAACTRRGFSRRRARPRADWRRSPACGRTGRWGCAPASRPPAASAPRPAPCGWL